MFVLSNQLPRDDNPLNMARPLVNLQALDVAVIPLYRIFVGIAPVAMQKDRLRGGAQCRFDGEQLGDGGGFGRGPRGLHVP